MSLEKFRRKFILLMGVYLVKVKLNVFQLCKVVLMTDRWRHMLENSKSVCNVNEKKGSPYFSMYEHLYVFDDI